MKVHLLAFCAFVLALPMIGVAQEKHAEQGSQLQPEAFYQPKGGKFAVEAAGAYIPEASSEGTLIATGAKAADTKISGAGFGAAVSYGVTNDLALTLRTAYISRKIDVVPVNGTTSSYKSSGFDDLVTAGQYTLRTSFANFYLGAAGRFSLEKSKDATTTTEGNIASGGMSFQPMIGASSTLAPGLTLGTAIAYQFLGDRTVNRNDSLNPTTEYTIRGGNTLSFRGIVEYRIQSIAFDASAGVDSRESASKNSSGVDQTYTKANVSTELGLSSTITLNPFTAIVLSYQASLFQEEEDVSQVVRNGAWVRHGLGGLLRFEF